MATQAPNNLPLLYRGLEPLSRQAHADKKVRRIATIPGLTEAHAIPVTVDEFMLAGRHRFAEGHRYVNRGDADRHPDVERWRDATLFQYRLGNDS